MNVVFTPSGKVGLIASNAIGHTTSGKIGPGDKSSSASAAKTSRFGKSFRIRRAGRSRVIYRVRRGRIRYVAVATRSVTKSGKRLRAYLRRAGLR